MEITLTDDEIQSINEVGELTGLEKREVVKRALITYLENLRLQKETEVWDQLSDESLINFEKEYE